RQSERDPHDGPDSEGEAGGRLAEGSRSAEIRVPAPQGLTIDATLVAQGLLNGVLFGGVFSLMAVGLTLIFGVMRVVNFAHGDMMVWGMYLAWLMASRGGIDPYVGFVVCAAALFVLGIDVRRVYAVAFGVGAACVGAAGALVAPLLPFQPPTGLQLSVASFNIVIIGGMGSLLGAFVGGLLVAVAESLGAIFLKPSLKELVSFSLLVLILL